jgi:large subunit ribosomal protein L21
MSKIAVIKTGGKQYKVAEGQTLSVEKISAEKGKKVKFDTLLIADKDKVEVGQPSLGEKVEAEVMEQGKGDKVTVIKYKNKIRYKRTKGHRQPYTSVKIAKVA